MREERPIIALDFPAFEDVKHFLEHFPEDEKLFVKIGMVLKLYITSKGLDTAFSLI